MTSHELARQLLAHPDCLIKMWDHDRRAWVEVAGVMQEQEPLQIWDAKHGHWVAMVRNTQSDEPLNVKLYSYENEE